MLRGDLQTTPLTELLRSLAGAAATGCVYLLPDGQRFDAEEATITLRDGAICGVTLPGTGDALGTRLVATHQLTPDELAEAKLAQETELASWMLADLLIHLGLADEHHVQIVTAEQALSDLTEICAWKCGSWRFRRRARLGRNLPEPLPVHEALETVDMRQEQWRRLLPTILGADAVVSLAADASDADPVPGTSDSAVESDASDTAVEMDSEAFVLLCTVDGSRTINDLAVASGFTLLDAGLLTAGLVASGLVQVARDMSKPPLPADTPEIEAADDAEASQDRSGGATDDEPDELAATFSFESDGPLLPENISYGFSPTGSEWEPPSWQQSDRLADALARVSAALSEAMVEPANEAADPQAVEFAEPAPLEALIALTEHDDASDDATNETADDAADDAAGEAFLDAIEEPFDNAFLEAVEAVTTAAPPEAEPEPVDLEQLVVDEIEPEIVEPEPAIEEFVAVVEDVVAVDEVAAEQVTVEQPPSRQSGRADAAEASRMLSQFAGETASQPAEEVEEEEPEPVAEKHPAPTGAAPAP
ncbi:MAG: hypothetical protein JWN96_1071, partial [Mycobacterium sp.]|nr:hypothetical protein [Mycobacterium sp.]